jgi:hypothetical protein
VSLRASVRAALEAHGLAVTDADTPALLKERLNDLYLEDVRRLKARQRAGEIPLRDYAAHAQALKESFPLLGLPLDKWTEPES